MRILAIDPGGSRVGVARGDDETGLVSPLTVMDYTKRSTVVAEIAELAASHRADRIVIGLPTNSNGEDTPACARSRALAADFEELGFTVFLQPEYLSTNEARRRAREIGRRRNEPVDDLAAQIILEEYLSSP